MNPEKKYISLDLPASKSINNRLYVLNHLYHLNLNIKNPCSADDCILMDSILNSDSNEFNCHNAGTVFRFLTAVFAIGSQKVILSGSDRMHQRPIGILVDALRDLGAEIQYLKKKGFPPISIQGKKLKTRKLYLNAEVSSQFISALMMIGPKIGGVQLELNANIASKPYIHLTQNLMNVLGFKVSFEGNSIVVLPEIGNPETIEFTVENDWSSLVFWFIVLRNTSGLSLCLPGFQNQSVQGDSILQEWSGSLGISCILHGGTISLERSEIPILHQTFWNFKNHPDLAPAIIVLLASQKKMAQITGLETLKDKESDRIEALRNELKKCKVHFEKQGDAYFLDATGFKLLENTVFESYNDHRIAMAFGALKSIKPITIKNPECVSKSYTYFWNDLERVLKFT